MKEKIQQILKDKNFSFEEYNDYEEVYDLLNELYNEEILKVYPIMSSSNQYGDDPYMTIQGHSFDNFDYSIVIDSDYSLLATNIDELIEEIEKLNNLYIKINNKLNNK